MRESDPLAEARDFPVALSLLSRLPLRLPDAAYARGARSAWAWPLVGLLLAGLAGVVAIAFQGIDNTGVIPSLLALATLALATGAMHEDGLADCADGFWGGQDRTRRLEIMKDSRIGAFGVIALVLGLGLRAAALAALARAGVLLPALLVAAMLSRAAMPAVMQALSNARGAGLSARTGAPGWPAVWLGLGLALLISWPLVGLSATLSATLAGGAVTVVWAAIARTRIGGQTGDVLGATQQLSEIAVLLALLTAQ